MCNDHRYESLLALDARGRTLRDRHAALDHRDAIAETEAAKQARTYGQPVISPETRRLLRVACDEWNDR